MHPAASQNVNYESGEKINVLGKIHYKRMNSIYKNRGFSRVTQLGFEDQSINAQGKGIQDTGHEIKENA